MIRSDALANGRAAARLAFAHQATGDDGATLEAASTDASARSYWRVRSRQGTFIVMDSPPGAGNLDAWLDVGARLRRAGLTSPEVISEDRALGLLLLSDLGTRLYLHELADATVDGLYEDALAALVGMQARVEPHGLPRFDAAFVLRELELMPTWFVERHLGITPAQRERSILDRAFHGLANAVLEQPHTFMHRDFHSRNLLVVPRHNPGIIDFQDAVIGPVTYDAASLLRDCYVAWDDARVQAWAETCRQRLIDAGALARCVDAMRWRRWFDLTGLQRHLKVLGIFCRLWYRDHKRGYLADLPRVWGYIQGVGSRYPDFREFLDLLGRWADGTDLAEPRA